MTAIKLTPAKRDIEFTVGTDLNDLYLTFVDVAGDPVDISGYTIEAKVLRGAVVLATDFATAVSGAGNNVLQLSMTDTETTEIGVERGLTWSLRMTSGAITKEWVAGQFVGFVQGAGRTGSAATTRVFTVGSTTVTFSTVAPLATILAAVASDIDDPESAISAALVDQFVLLADADRVDGEGPVWDESAGEWISAAGGGGGVTLEQVQDDLGNTSLIAGTSLTKTYNDGAGTITLDVDAADFATAGHNHSATYQPLDSDLTAIAALTTTSYGRALLSVANLAALQATIGTTGTPSASTYLRGDGSWSTPSGSGASVSSGAGAPGSTPGAVGDIYIDTTADVAYMATGTAASTDWQMGVAVATSTAGTWESRPQAQIVIWAAGTDTAATTPGAAVGDDIVILAEDADLTAIAALTSAADKVPYATGAGTWAMADLPSFGRTLIANTTALAAVQDLRTAPATVTGTTDTLAAADDNTVILYTAAGAVTVTLANIATGFECVLVCLGAGGLSVAAGGMSYANSFTPKLTIAQGESLYIKQTAASTFIVVGGTAT